MSVLHGEPSFQRNSEVVPKRQYVGECLDALLRLDEDVRLSRVLGASSPDDPAQADYWALRRGKNKPLLDRNVLILLAVVRRPSASYV